jgi:insertion element IS1 protein InsB
MWSYVEKKSAPRWLWHAIDHQTGKVLAYVCGPRQDQVFLQLKAFLEPFGITRYHTDDWGAYTRCFFAYALLLVTHWCCDNPSLGHVI